MKLTRRSVLHLRFVVWIAIAGGIAMIPTATTFADEQPSDALPANTVSLLNQFCLKCHSTDEAQGELDLQRYSSLDHMRADVGPWLRVVEMLDNGEMPPEDSPQPTAAQRKQLRDWVQGFLNAEALRNAGDPGPVVLRRLNNSEYTYTIQDLTGVPLQPAKQFPVDSAAGEGFTNVGDALVMSPSMVQKYLDAGKDVAAHAVLLPDGIRFSESTTRRDWSNQIVAQIRQLYADGTTGASRTDQLNQWSGDPNSSTANDGRVDLVPYLSQLIQHRHQLMDSQAADKVARENSINAKYLHILANAIFSDADSALLNDVRRRIEAAKPEDAAAIADVVKSWQSRLWKFNTVGHLGLVIPWQQAVSPIEATLHLQFPFAAPKADRTSIVLTSRSVIADGPNSVVWKNARVERASGLSAIMLRDVKAVSVVWPELKRNVFANFAKYLAAVAEVRTSQQAPELSVLAARYEIQPAILTSLLNWLGIGSSSEPEIAEYLNLPLIRSGSEFVNGWGLQGADALSVVANSSDNQVQIPGDMRAHRIATHPMPDRFSAVGWKSPFSGTVSIAPYVHHAHGACGNGVGWKVELRRGAEQRILLSGLLDKSAKTDVAPLSEFGIQKNDLVSLIIEPRDNNHSCDLTEIELAVTEQGGAGRVWSLTKDCADNIAAGNPHEDRFGNLAIWHFYTGLLDGKPSGDVVPHGSLMASWLNAADSQQAEQFAQKLQALLTEASVGEMTAADAEIRRLLHSVNGPLFSKVDFAELAASVEDSKLSASEFGINMAELSPFADGVRDEGGASELVMKVPSVVEVSFPADLVEGCTFAASAFSVGAGSVQVTASSSSALTTAERESAVELVSGVPVVASTEAARQRVQQAFDEFRSVFPAAMCHARIVPVDEVVTLLLYHREDDYLSRLMLSEEQSLQLDRLWSELRFVSQDALRLEVALEQILEFSTQDADPRRFDPVLKPIADGAASFRKWQTDTEHVHLAAVVDFADRAYRRDLTDLEDASLRSLYAHLRSTEIDHEDAIRLLIARILASPTFLYRNEQPGDSSLAVRVSADELANRLSYFLWASQPDATLRALAADGSLLQDDVLLQQTRRMLVDSNARRMAIEFGCQWLHIRDFHQHDEKNEAAFPEFAALRGDMYEESIRCWEHLIRNDGSILELIDADHTFVNARLAKHYGINAEVSADWQLIDGVRETHRGGILTQASLLSKQSGASRTSPILRGTWISETLLGERLPRPPKGVPVLPEEVPDGLSERQLTERHTSDPACVKCHQRIDPYGFALEGFDAIGRYRTNDKDNNVINTATDLPDGTTLTGLDGLKQYLLTVRREDFVRQFCRKLLGYSLGRSAQLSDEPLIGEMMAQLKKNNYRFSAAVETIVVSQQFQMIRGREQ
ncbi:MAG: DUF1592 domain-containing protein [Fuerstiella sp.]